MLLIFLCCGVLFAGYAALILYYTRGWKRIPAYVPVAEGSIPVTRISVIVPVRNEEENIPGLLDSLAKQNYPKEQFEVIVIDDHSTDRTAEVMRACPYPEFEIHCLSLKEMEVHGKAKFGDRAYKKMGIESGVLAASGTLIVTTDADCRFDPDWLRTLAAFHAMTGAKCMAAPVKVDAGSGWLSVFEALDFITLQGITGAAIDTGLHSLGNGANLAYERDAFLAVDGFRGVDHIPSGDDMFLMYKIARKYPGSVRYVKSKEAIVTTKAAGSWRSFVNQRVRWASKADRYEEKRIFWILLLVYTVNLLFPLLLIAAIWWDRRYGRVLIAMLAIKILVEAPFVNAVAGFFGQRRLMIWFILMQPLHIIYTLVIGWLGKFGSYRWKGRKVSS